jgi:pimeloyl-ACP methyl ester carboxylesterase
MSILSAFRRRGAALMAALAVAITALLVGASGPNVADAVDPQAARKPTVVLVHGAFADSSSWSSVVTQLHNDGYPVFSVANPLRRVSFDATYVADYLRFIKGPIVLVGHSYAGMVITEAVRRNSNVKALVYVNAYAPDTGETATGLTGKFPGSTLGPTLQQVKLSNGTTDLIVRQDKFWQQFGADLPRETGYQLAVAQRPAAARSLTDRASGRPAWRSVPSYFQIATGDRNIPPALQDFMAKRARAKAVQHIQGASHLVMLSEPGITTRFIELAARGGKG